MVSGSTATSYKRSFLLLKDVIAIFRSNVKRRLRIYIITANLSECNILRTSFVSSVVHYITVVSTSNVKNIALIYRSIL